MIIIDLLLPLLGLFILLDILRFIDIQNEIKFKNTILDLDINKKYTLQDIKRIQKYIDQVQGNLLRTDTSYYDYFLSVGFFTTLFSLKKEYRNNKIELSNLLVNVLHELDDEKKFFGLNKREKEIFLDLNKNSNLTDSDLKSILELKDIVVNRYQELMKRNEQSDRLSKISIRLGYISLLITVISLYISYV